jgi:LPXTG-motif cell wall-anchored protein
MRKVMLLAAMLAMVLAAAAPAFAQAVAIDEGDDVEYNAVCQNILGSVGDIEQEQEGEAEAVATDDSAAAAEVAQEQGVTIEQVNECLNEVDLDGDGFVTHVELEKFVVVATASASASTAAEVQYKTASATASASASAAAELPETGGASLLALGAGALLVAGGLVARRIVR